MSYGEGAKLIATRPGRPGEEYPLGDRPVTIGREPSCDIVIDSPVVSRNHARIEPRGEDYVISDAGASNGLFVNGKRVQGSQLLVPGDKLQIGEESFVYMPRTSGSMETQMVRGAAIPPPGAGRPPVPLPAAPAPMPEMADLSTDETRLAMPPTGRTGPENYRVPPPPAPDMADLPADETRLAPPAGRPGAGFQAPPPPPPGAQPVSGSPLPPPPSPSGFQPPPVPPPPSYAQPAAWGGGSDAQQTGRTAQLAGFWRRLGALFIDGIVLNVISSIIGLFFRPVGGVLGTGSSLSLLIGIAYFTWGYGTGQTLGCRVLGLRIVDQDTGGMPGYGKGLGRYFAGILSAIPLFLGFFWMLWDHNKQTWHDKLAKTLVVFEGERRINEAHFNLPGGR